MTEFTVERGVLNLYGVLKKPNLEKCPVIIMHHGFGGCIRNGEDNIFTAISERLLKSGIASVRFDFGGRGRSGVEYKNVNLLTEINDAIAVLEYVKNLDFVTEVYILGHSQGGVVGGIVAGYYTDVVKKLVLLAPAAVLKEDAQSGRCFDANYDTNHIPDTVTVCGKKMGGHFFRIAKSLPIYELTGQFTNPVLIVGGMQDKVVSRKSLEKYESVLKNSKLMVYPHIDHGMAGADEENMLREIISFLEV